MSGSVTAPDPRPALSGAVRNRVWLAGGLSNLVLSFGLVVSSLGIVALVALTIVGYVSMSYSPESTSTPLKDLLITTGLESAPSWVLWVILAVIVISGALIAVAGVWLGKAMLSSIGFKRPWKVAASASGVLVGLGIVVSFVLPPVAAPIVTIWFAVSLALHDTSGVFPGDQVVVLIVLIVLCFLQAVVFTVAGSLVWWWMAHAQRQTV